MFCLVGNLGDNLSETCLNVWGRTVIELGTTKKAFQTIPFSPVFAPTLSPCFPQRKSFGFPNNFDTFLFHSEDIPSKLLATTYLSLS
jgi:hypothetical protein